MYGAYEYTQIKRFFCHEVFCWVHEWVHTGIASIWLCNYNDTYSYKDTYSCKGTHMLAALG